MAGVEQFVRQAAAQQRQQFKRLQQLQRLVEKQLAVTVAANESQPAEAPNSDRQTRTARDVAAAAQGAARAAAAQARRAEAQQRQQAQARAAQKAQSAKDTEREERAAAKRTADAQAVAERRRVSAEKGARRRQAKLESDAQELARRAKCDVDLANARSKMSTMTLEAIHVTVLPTAGMQRSSRQQKWQRNRDGELKTLRGRRQGRAPQSGLPQQLLAWTVSVLLPTFRRLRSLRRCVASSWQ